MEINKEIYEKIKNNNNMITTQEATALGFSRTLLTQYVKEGYLERVRHGVYILPDSVHDDMYTLGMRSEHIVFSHDSALFLNGLSRRTPFIHSITIPSNTCVPASIRDECVCYYVKPELHHVGITERRTTLGNIVKCYDVERTICDLLRRRVRLDEETVISGIKEYARYRNKDLNRLAEYAETFRVNKDLKRYMEVLL